MVVDVNRQPPGFLVGRGCVCAEDVDDFAPRRPALVECRPRIKHQLIAREPDPRELVLKARRDKRGAFSTGATGCVFNRR
jgi:hypothetical protein